MILQSELKRDIALANLQTEEAKRGREEEKERQITAQNEGVEVLELRREIALANLRTEEARRGQEEEKARQITAQNEGESCIRAKIELTSKEVEVVEKRKSLAEVVLAQEREKTEQLKETTAQMRITEEEKSKREIALAREDSLRTYILESEKTKRENERMIQATKQEAILSSRRELQRAIGFRGAQPSPTSTHTVCLPFRGMQKVATQKEELLSIMSY